MNAPEYSIRSRFLIHSEMPGRGVASPYFGTIAAGILHDTERRAPALKPKLRLMAEEVLRFKPMSVVDIGYAQEPNVFLKGTEVYGVDLVSAPAPYAKTYQIDLNADPLPFSAGSIDAVTMGCTLAHVSNPLKVLADINRILKPEGILVVSSPNPNYYWETVMNVFYDHFKTRVSKAKHVEHFFEFSRYNMRTSAQRAGFTVLKEIGFLFALVKTPLRFNVEKLPGASYEIIYTLQKTSAPRSYATFEEAGQGIKEVATKLFE